MKEDLFDDIISTDVSEEVSKILLSICNIDDLKLYLETNNVRFKNTKFYQIESDIKYIKLYFTDNYILVTTGFFKAKEEDKIDILNDILEKIDKLDVDIIVDRKSGLAPYQRMDALKKLNDILDNSTIAESYKYNLKKGINYRKIVWNNYFSKIDLSEIIYNDYYGSDEETDYFILMNDDDFVKYIMDRMRYFSMNLPNDTESKLRKAIAKINENNKN